MKEYSEIDSISKQDEKGITMTKKILKLINEYKNITIDNSSKQRIDVLVNLLNGIDNSEVTNFYQFLQETFERLKNDGRKATISIVYAEGDYPDTIISILFKSGTTVKDILAYLYDVDEIRYSKFKEYTFVDFVGFTFKSEPSQTV